MSVLSGRRACSARCTRRSRARPGSRVLLPRRGVGCGMLHPRLCLAMKIRIRGVLAIEMLDAVWMPGFAV